MSNSIGLIFPHQLSEHNPVLKSEADLFALLEDPLFFGDYQYPLNFHKQKLVLHRASMQFYYDQLESNKKYIEYKQVTTQKKWQQSLLSLDADHIHCMEVDDFALKKRLVSFCKKHKIKLTWHPSTLFLNTIEETTTWINDQKNLQQTSFYIWQRKKHQLLLDKNNKPLGGKWTYDTQNRKKLPKSVDLPKKNSVSFSKTEHQYVKSAKQYVEKQFSVNPGSLSEYNYPITTRQASKALTHFLEAKINSFGPYQDAISQRDHALFHSLLSSSLNIGLLDPKFVIQQVIDSLDQDNPDSLSSVEGFVRQVLGWREFMRATYHTHGVEMRTSNFFNHTKKLNKKWWTANVGLAIVDQTISKALDRCYGHHIERLMIISNLMLLCRIDPKEVYKWFMELFIDAYDWVMVGNVFEMGQFTTGGIFVTKPYVSSANYLTKMSDFKLDTNTQEVWNALYWSFIAETEKALQDNSRMSLMHTILHKKSADELKQYQSKAEDFINSVTQ